MLLTHFLFFAKHLKNARKRRHGCKPARRRSAHALQQTGNCRCAVEALEDRVLLAAAGLASPTFVLGGHVSTPGASRAVAASTVAPIDPAQMTAAYGVNLISFSSTRGTGAGQTIAIVDAYNDPDISADANSFNTEFGLQQFNVSGGPTLQVLNQNGGTSLASVPNASPGTWDLEESLDVEWAHSIAPQANIILFEANSNSFSDLLTAVQTAAATAGVSTVSMSWSAPEFSGEASLDSSFVTPANHQGVTFLASTGDSAAPAGYPAYSPNVVAVGGTTLDIDSSGDYLGESAWSDGGGGVSVYESQPGYQTGKVNGTSSTNRTAPDVSMDADPNTGVYVLDSFDGGYYEVGGTSLACPMWAGLISIADQGRALQNLPTLNGSSQTLPTLYDLGSANFHDITTGSNGFAAGTGYDLATGIGSPTANLVVPALAGFHSQSPSVTAPSGASVNENSSLVFSGSVISVTDAAAIGTTDSLSISVSDGDLSLGSLTGLTFASGSNNSPSMTVSGTLANLNAALNSLVYTPNTGFSGPDSLRIAVNDSGDGLSGSATVPITVNAVTRPTVAAPAAAAMNENTPLIFSSGNGNAISLTDNGASGTSDSLALAVTHGTLTLGSTTGLTFSSGSNGSTSMTVVGTLVNLNTALAGLKFTPTTGFSGSTSLGVTLTDSGDNLSGSATVALSVNPFVSAPTTASVNENSSLTFSSSSNNAITLTDGAASGTSDSLTLTVAHGTLKLGSTSGLTFVSGSNSSASMTIKGTLSNLNAALKGVKFTPATGFSGPVSLALTLKDSGDNLTGSAAVAISVIAPPTVSAPATATASENGSLTFSPVNGNAIALTDAAASATSDSLTLTVSHGKLNLGSTTGLTFSSGSNGAASMTVKGTVANLNAALKGLLYTPKSGYKGSDSLKISVTDSADKLSGTTSIAITVGATSSITSSVSAADETDTTQQDDEATQWAGVVAALEALNR